MKCQSEGDCGSKATTSFRVKYHGEFLYRKKVCDYHAELWRASKFATELEDASPEVTE